MDARRSLLLPVALLLALAPAVGATAQDDPAAHWNQRLNEAGAHLEAGEFESARAVLDEVRPVLVSRLRGAGPGREALAFALFLDAAAEAGLGREEEALWRWWAAQSLDPRMRRQQVPELAGAGAFLHAHRLREAGSLPDGSPVPGGDELVPPRPVELPRPEAPYSAWGGTGVEIEIVVGADGRVTQPVLLDAGEAAPGQIFVQLEALRGWRFRPASRGGSPVATTLGLIDLRLDRFPLRWLTDASLRPLHEMLLAGDWTRASRRAEELIAESRAEEGWRVPLGDVLLMRAVADANLGRLRRAEAALWAAEGLGVAPFSQLRAYGSGGRFAWDERRRCTRGGAEEPEPEVEPEPCLAADPLGDPTVTPPRPLRPAPFNLEAGDDPEGHAGEQVLVRLVIDPAGRPTEASLLAARDGRLAPALLSAVAAWRFEPARRDEVPVSAIYETSLERAPVVRAVERAAGADVESWRRRLAGAEAALASAEPAAALEAAVAVQGEMERQLAAGGSALLAEALTLRALAEAALAAGEPALAEAAAWHWVAAQNLAPQVRYRDLARHGAAATRLAGHPLPLASGGVAEAERRGAAPVVVERVDPPAGAAGGGMVEIAVAVGADGRPRAPLWRAGGSPAQLSAAFEALRSWRFEPADGAARHRVVVQVAEAVKGGLELSAGLQSLIARVRASLDHDPALAACLWSSAQSLEPRLSVVDPAALVSAPPAEDFLRRHLLPPRADWVWTPNRWREPREVDDEVEAPVKTWAPQPGYTAQARRYQVEGRVIVRSVIGVDGRPKRLRVLKGLPHGLTESAVSRICTWRFEPARLDGEPIEVGYNLEVRFVLR